MPYSSIPLIFSDQNIVYNESCGCLTELWYTVKRSIQNIVNLEDRYKDKLTDYFAKQVATTTKDYDKTITQRTGYPIDYIFELTPEIKRIYDKINKFRTQLIEIQGMTFVSKEVVKDFQNTYGRFDCKGIKEKIREIIDRYL